MKCAPLREVMMKLDNLRRREVGIQINKCTRLACAAIVVVKYGLSPIKFKCFAVSSRYFAALLHLKGERRSCGEIFAKYAMTLGNVNRQIVPD